MTWIESLIAFDKTLFLLINGWHSPFFDMLMFWVSHKFIWIPFYAFLLYLIIKNYKWQSLQILLFIVLLTFLCDQTSVHLFKNVFHRLRPCHNYEFDGLIHLVNNKCGGQFGFISSHACNTFGLASLLYFLLNKKYGKLSFLLFVWAAFVSYSRIYLGVHYPADVFFGGLVGVVIGWIVFMAYNLFLKYLCNRKSC
ncbi:MAG: phosphatase PAP2 family protein [Bacteroidales bacterium]|nr:phosphatase PAP2 family protein [Bacteroidales bacterium]